MASRKDTAQIARMISRALWQAKWSILSVVPLLEQRGQLSKADDLNKLADYVEARQKFWDNLVTKNELDG